MSEHQRGFREATYLIHLGEAQRHQEKADRAFAVLKTFHPDSHLVSGGKEDRGGT